MHKITELEIENLTIKLLEFSSYQYIYGQDIAPDLPASGKQAGLPALDATLKAAILQASDDRPELTSFEDVLFSESLETVVWRINYTLPALTVEDALKQIQRIHSTELIANNESFHRMITEGVRVSYEQDGKERGDLVWLVDFNNPENNDFVLCNQFTVIENNVNKRLDVIFFVNGLPLVVIEVKNPADENVTVKSAFKQIQTYKRAIPSLFTYKGFCVISDGLEARAGTISSGYSIHRRINRAWQRYSRNGQRAAGNGPVHF